MHPPTTAPKPRNRTCDSMLWRILKLTVCILLLQWTTRTGRIAIAMSPGAVTPNEIKIGIGDNANITCTIFEREIGNSSMIWFKEVNRTDKANYTFKKIRQPNENITILNASTVVINIRNATEFVGVYECMRGNNLIGTTELQVGTPPKMVEDFVCRVDNYEKMQCNFTPPENKILTKYSLLYKVNDTSFDLDNCNLTECNNSKLCCEFVPGKMYHPTRKVYKIKLTGTNALGVTSKIIYVNCTEIVVPAAVDKVNISNVTTDSVTFSWYIMNFGPYEWPDNGLEYKICVRPNDFDDWTCKIPEWRNCNSSCSVSWYHLPYAFYEYDYNIRAKATTTKNQEHMWSSPYTGNFKTKSRPPQQSPKTDANAFYTKSKETRLYWQALEVYEKNGPQFEYIIECPNGTLLRTENTSISVSAPSAQTDSYYIHARNADGDSSSPSLIRVFPEAGCGADLKPNAKFDENYKYELSWWRPLNSTGEVKNYTVFWCQPKALSSTECEGNINFNTVNNTITNYIVPSQHHRLILAVAANYTNCSTGMQWIKCEASVLSELGKLEPVVKPVNGSAIEISWSLEGICSSILAGYNISYCQVSKNDNLTQNCISQMVTKTLNLSNSEKGLQMYTIGKLKPFSKYRIEMYMFSQNDTGVVSAPLFAETKEAAPSAPTDLKVSSVMHNSVNISWQHPQFANGILRSYKVHAIYRTKDKDSPTDTPLEPVEMGQVLKNDSDEQIPTFFQLTNLMSYSDYTIYVTAYTGIDSASAPSNAINISTSIGTPTNPLDVNSNDDGDYRVLSWSKPMYAAGRVEFYEIVMWIRHKDMETGNYIEEKKMTLLAGGRTCRYKAPECSDPSYTFSIEVRAVNVATKEEMQSYVLGTSPTLSPARRRRHTSPEINSIVISGIQNYNHSDVDTDRDSRADFERAKTTTMPTVLNYNGVSGQSSKPAERDDDYVIDNSFKCENLAYMETRNSTYVEHMLSHKHQKAKETNLFFFHSPWQKASVQISCSESSPQLSGALIMLGLSIVSILSLFVSHHVWKKLNKMKNIEAVLPEGLVDHLPNYKFDGFADFGDISNAGKQIIIDENTSMSRSKNNCLMFGHNREAHHLLPGAHNSPANAHDSLTPSSSSSKGSCDERMEQLESHSYEDAFNEEQSSTQSTDTLELNAVTSSALNRAATVASNTRPITECDYEVEAVNTTPGGYVTPTAMLICAGNTASSRDTGPLMANTTTTTQTTPSGYVAPQALAMLSSSNTLQQQRQPAPNNAAMVAGYTTLDALTLPTTISTTNANVPAPTDISLDPDPADELILPTNKNSEADVAAAIAYEILNNNNNSNNKLSNGYVTQRQLSELGQLLH